MKKIFNISITVIITVTIVILGMFIFRSSYLRLWETIQDFGLSIAYYFSIIFKGESNITPTVNGLSNVFKASGYLPVTAEEFKRKITQFSKIFISKDNFPFIKVFTDEQRPESWGSDARDLCDIIHIRDCSEQYISLPFYTLKEMAIEWIYMRFIDLYEDFRFKRGGNTLLIYMLKKVAAWLYKRNAINYNLYGYSILKIEKERGTQDGKKKKQKYYLCNRKIYNRRFSTDCFSDYFNEQARKTKVGLNDYAEYSAVKATVIELKQQNSYFVNSLYKCDGEEGK